MSWRSSRRNSIKKAIELSGPFMDAARKDEVAGADFLHLAKN